jgi:glycerol kinase
MKYIIALDQGTTSSRALLLNEKGIIVRVAQKEFRQIFPKPGWVEHDPEEIWESQSSVLKEVIRKSGIKARDISAIGITNQRETTILWDRITGQPVYNAIVWQDKRTADICETLKSGGYEKQVRRNTGLVIDSYFSATKIAWILKHFPKIKAIAKKGGICFGTVDSWLIWKLTKGKVHATDYSNASRTMLFNIRSLKWDRRLLSALDIPASVLPRVFPSSRHFGYFELEGHKIPITGVLGDQQAALFGQGCFEVGTAKNTYGTGCFVLMNTGNRIPHSKSGLITTIAWGIDNKVTYALEGSVFIAGAAIQWLRDGLNIIQRASDSESMAVKAGPDDNVYVVPAFAGLGAPYWDMYARGAVFGLTRDSGKNQLVKATLQSLAYQTRDVIEAMEKDSGIPLKNLKVDGGACANDFLMQFQSDILGDPVERPEVIESTALGAAAMAAIYVGLWKKNDLKRLRKINRIFKPSIKAEKREKLYDGWKKAVNRTIGWLKND